MNILYNSFVQVCGAGSWRRGRASLLEHGGATGRGTATTAPAEPHGRISRQGRQAASRTYSQGEIYHKSCPPSPRE